MYSTPNLISRNTEKSIFDIREQKMPVVEVFKSFQTEGTYDKTNTFAMKCRKKRNEIKSMINNNLGLEGFISPPLPSALKNFRIGLGRMLFNPNSRIKQRIDFLNHQQSKKAAEAHAKIDVGNLMFLDLNDNIKTSFDNHINEVKKMYLKRSAHFLVSSNTKEIQFSKLHNDLSNSKVPSRKRSMSSQNNNNNYTSTPSRSHLQTPCVTTNNIIPLDTNCNSPSPSNSLHLSPNETSSNWRETAYKTHSKFGPCIDDINNHKRKTKKNISYTRSSCQLTTYQNDIIKKKISKKDQQSRNFIIKSIDFQKNNLVKSIQSLSEEQQKAEKELFTMLDNEIYSQKSQLDQLQLTKSLKMDFTQDVETILEVQIMKKQKIIQTKNLLKEAIKDNKDQIECKKAIIKLSDGINKMNNETALKFADTIIQSYLSKTKKTEIVYHPIQKYNYSKNIEFDMKLRHKADENYFKMKKISLSYDKIKKKLDFYNRFIVKKKKKKALSPT